MKLLFLIFLPIILTASFDTKEPRSWDMSVFHTKIGKSATKAMNNKKIKCRIVCDKTIYDEETISKALKFYKDSPKHKFK